jgi:hypothetical protein
MTKNRDMIKWEYGPGGYSLKSHSVTPLTLAMMSLAKEDAEFTDDQLRSFAKGFVDYIASITGFADRVAAKNFIDKSPTYEVSDYAEVTQQYLYKYVSGDSASYYHKGSFQVGSIGYFQQMENEKARDELEGFAFITTRMGNRIANLAITMGLNFYVFCGTDQDNESLSDYHLKNFGSVLLKIDLIPFAEKVAKRLGARSYKVMKVKYANAKMVKTELPIQMTPESFSNLSSNDMQAFMEHLIKDCTVPCLYTKPGWFKEEIETRIVFEMPYDVNQSAPKRFEHTGLVKHIQFIS